MKEGGGGGVIMHLVYASTNGVGGQIETGAPLVMLPILVSDSFGSVGDQNKSGALVVMRA